VTTPERETTPRRDKIGPLRRYSRVFGGLVLVLVLLPLAAHFAIRVFTRPKLPPVVVETRSATHEGKLRRFGDSYVLERDGILEVGLSGNPEAIGYAHARLLFDAMRENEGILLARFSDAVPSRILRTLLLDVAAFRYRDLDEGMGEDRKRELAAMAFGFQPDPYADLFPTYQRFVYLNALYDIALSFEHSPLLGCTTMLFQGDAVPDGGALVGRTFDFEVDTVFDRRKAVFLVREQGKIPFASVAWPGLVGVVSGMNATGLFIVVHGGRAGEPQTQGEPVVHALRRVLSETSSVAGAVRALGERDPLVSHIVIVADETGEGAVIERVPGKPPHVEKLPARAAVSNHFAGPSRDDPKNLRVRRETTSDARHARASELVHATQGAATPERMLTMLRDRSGAGSKPLPAGDRRAIDAHIATHGVIADTRARILWVSEAPHLSGRFVEFDLGRMLDRAYRPETSGALPALPQR
jgi:isopenicillin-N N-acyltransferase-like protein